MGTDVEKRREREEYIYMKMLSSCIIHANLNFPDFEMRPFDYKKTSMALLSNFSHDMMEQHIPARLDSFMFLNLS